MSRRESSRSRGPISRLLALAVVAGSLATSLLVATASSASAASADYDFLAKVNASRADHGLPALTMMSDLHSLATSWSAHMADGGCGGQGDICHNPNLTTDVSNWQSVGENVGVGPDVSAIETAFMNSPEHRANILDPGYTQIGIGTAVGKDGRLYVTQDFRQPMHTSSASTSSGTSATSTAASHASVPRSAPVLTASTLPAVQAPPAVAAGLRHAARHAPAASDPVSRALRFVATMDGLDH